MILGQTFERKKIEQLQANDDLFFMRHHFCCGVLKCEFMYDALFVDKTEQIMIDIFLTILRTDYFNTFLKMCLYHIIQLNK